MFQGKSLSDSAEQNCILVHEVHGQALALVSDGGAVATAGSGAGRALDSVHY